MEFKPPEYLSLQGNVSENWRQWKQRFVNFLEAKEASGKNDKVKIAMLLTCIGPEAHERFNHLQFTEGEDKAKYDHVMDKLETHFQGIKRTVFTRYQFWTCARDERSFPEYISQLRTLAQKCEFQEMENMIRDKLVFSAKEKPLKERLAEGRWSHPQESRGYMPSI